MSAERILSRVVLPAPFGPSRATQSPDRSSKLTFSRAHWLPKALESWRTHKFKAMPILGLHGESVPTDVGRNIDFRRHCFKPLRDRLWGGSLTSGSLQPRRSIAKS